MIIVWGTRGHEKDLKARPQGVCPYCGTQNSFSLKTTYQTFNLYYVIPLAFYGRRYFAQCLRCGALMHLEKQAGKRVSKQDGAMLSPQEFEAVIEPGNPALRQGGAGQMPQQAFHQVLPQPSESAFPAGQQAAFAAGQQPAAFSAGQQQMGSADQSAPQRFCTNCGAEVRPGERFCGACGKPLL